MEGARQTALAIPLATIIGLGLAHAGGISDDVVKIGVLTDMSGQFSHESGEGSVTAIKMAVEDFGGKVLGKPVEVVVADHQNKPDVASAIARKWYEVDKVDMIANLINSSIALGVSQIAKEKDRVAIVNGSGSSRLTNDGCTPNSIHYAYDTYSLARGTGAALMKSGGTTWYFLTADYAFGHALEADTSAIVKAMGGQVVGSIRYPIDALDQSSFLLQAQASHAKVVALAGSGTVFVNAVKSAHEFGIDRSGQTLAGLLVWITDIKSLGLETAQGLVLTNAFYWDRDDETRAWSKRFYERMKRMPHMGDAGDYSSTMHYLKAIEAAGTDDAKAVMAKMREYALGLAIDRSFVAVLPLGGRHVNHLWRLLTDLDIPYATLLDLDRGRAGGGWGRIKTACTQLLENGVLPRALFGEQLHPDGPAGNLAAFDRFDAGDANSLDSWAKWLREFGVFFCAPLDLDYSMLRAFPAAYQVVEPGRQGPSIRGDPRTAVLGDDGLPALYPADQDQLLRWYRYLFLGRGKPSTHVRVLSGMPVADLAADAPEELSALLTAIIARLERPVPAEA